MTRDRAIKCIVATVRDYIAEYAEDARDIAALVGEESGHRPDAENVASLVEALREMGEVSAAERMEKLCK